MTSEKSNWSKCVDNAMAFLEANPELADFVKKFNNDDTGFMWSADPRVSTIADSLDSDGHSGASFACCMRACQHKLKSMVVSGPPASNEESS